MFLSKGNGIYCLWYDGTNGRRRKVSMRSRTKSDALAFFPGITESDARPAILRKVVSEKFREYPERSVIITDTETKEHNIDLIPVDS